MLYNYIGSTDTLFDRRGFSTTDDCPYNDLNEFAFQELDDLKREDFDRQVALPYKLGGLVDSDYCKLYIDNKKDIIICHDATDNESHFFTRKANQTQ